MTETLGVIHLVKKSKIEGEPSLSHDAQNPSLNLSESFSEEMQRELIASGALLFETCLRKIWLVHIDENTKSLVEKHNCKITYESQGAYQFILEVICGMHSPVVGETEVFGQFKDQIAKQVSPKNRLFKVVEDLVADAKEVRRKFLTHLGSQSYGSYCRKKTNDILNGEKHIDVIGFGSFAQSILPWIQKDETTGCVYARDVNKYTDQSVLTKFKLKDITKHQLHSTSNSILLICAPIKAKQIQQTQGYKLIIDLRETSDIDPIREFDVVKLKDVFEEIQKGAAKALNQKAKALLAIAECAQARNNKLTLRPFGWDDICA